MQVFKIFFKKMKYYCNTKIDNVKQIIINSILGHSNENVGQDIYTHITIQEKLEAIKLVTYKEKKLYIFNQNKAKNLVAN